MDDDTQGTGRPGAHGTVEALLRWIFAALRPSRDRRFVAAVRRALEARGAGAPPPARPTHPQRPPWTARPATPPAVVL